MNTLISNILSQAETTLRGHGAFGEIERHTRLDPQKFAELIIRECAKFLEENSGYDECNNAFHPEPEDLLKHFGVE